MKTYRKKLFNLTFLGMAALIITACGKNNTVTDSTNGAYQNGAYYNGMGISQAVDRILSSPEMKCINNNYYMNYPIQNMQYIPQGSYGRITYVYRGTLQRGMNGLMSGSLSGNQGIGTMSINGSSYVGKNSSKDLIIYTEMGTNQVEIVLYMCPDIMNYGVNLQNLNVVELSPARSRSCNINEINGGTLEIQSQNGVLPMAFYPIDVDSNIGGICNASF